MDFSGLTAADISSILGTIGDASKANDIDEQLQQAHKLRDTSVPDTVNGVPNFSGVLGSVLDAYRSKKDEQHLHNERDIINNRQAWNSETFWRALQARQAAQTQPKPAAAPAAAPGLFDTQDPMGLYR